MKTSTATRPHRRALADEVDDEGPATRSSETRSIVESRKAPAVVGPAPARATAPSSASQSEATMPTTSAQMKWPVMMSGRPATCSSRPMMVIMSAVKPRRARTTPTRKKPRRAPSV